MTVARLGHVASFVRGITFKPDDVVALGSMGTVACMRTKNVQAQLDLSDVWAVPKTFVPRDEQMLRAGDVLLSSANSWNLVGRCCLVPDLGYPASFGGFVAVLRAVSDQLDSSYLYRWFSSTRVQDLVRSFGRKTTNISNLDFQRCKDLQMPLPPLREQRHIAAVLDQADALRAKRREALAHLDGLAQAVFLDMFGDPRTNARQWDERSVGEVTACIVPGRDKPKSFTGGTPWVTTADLCHLGATMGSSKGFGLSDHEISHVNARVIPQGSVVISCVGDLGVVSIAGVPMVVNQQLHSFQCLEGVDGVFLMYCLAFQKGFMHAMASSTTLPYMNKSVCNSIPVVIPPLALQQSFASRIHAIESLKTFHRAALTELDALFASLQHRAFTGQLS